MADLSIHPRNWPTGNREKSNTRGNVSNARYATAIAGTERHLETNPNDGIARRRIATFTARMKGG